VDAATSALVAAARGGDLRALGRLISLVEDAGPTSDLSGALAPTGSCYVVGITGPPGVGKSTLTSALIAHWRGLGARVGVLAVDPSSPFSGGALLGDRVRMQTHATDGQVFIRSMASRGSLGGLAAATPRALRVLEAVGFDIVFVETVGVGQAEVDVAATADTTVVVLAPGLGDGVQAAKAGLLEVADVLVVNKADREGADDAVRDLRTTISAGRDRLANAWRPIVVRTVAVAEGGAGDLVSAILKHRAWLAASDEGERRRVARAGQEVRSLALSLLTDRFGLRAGSSRLAEFATRVAAGELDAYAAAVTLVSASGAQVPGTEVAG
jgi:LAO/AO transport system kinase